MCSTVSKGLRLMYHKSFLKAKVHKRTEDCMYEKNEIHFQNLKNFQLKNKIISTSKPNSANVKSCLNKFKFKDSVIKDA